MEMSDGFEFIYRKHTRFANMRMVVLKAFAMEKKDISTAIRLERYDSAIL